MEEDVSLFGAGEIEAPTLRRCHHCHVERPIEMFYVEREIRQSAMRGVRVRYPCRYCKRAENARQQGPLREAVDAIKVASGCVDCGIRDPEHPEIYDFDHLPGTEKVTDIAGIVSAGGSMEAVLAEIAKCEVVCANCHRIRTRQRDKKTFGTRYKIRERRDR